MRNIGQAVGVVLEVVGIAFLTGLGIKAECDRHKAVVKLHQKEFELAIEQIDNAVLKMENEHLKKQLEKCEKEEA